MNLWWSPSPLVSLPFPFSNISRSSRPLLDTAVFAAYNYFKRVERKSTPKLLTYWDAGN